MSKMLKIAIGLCLAGIMNLGAAAEVSKEMQKAVVDMVNAQGVLNTWPHIARNLTEIQALNFPIYMSAGVDRDAGLSATQRAKAQKVIEQLTPAAMAEFAALHQGVNGGQLVLDAALVVYPKHYTVAELRDLTTFFNSSALRKARRISAEVAEANARNPADRAEIVKRLEAEYTQEDIKALTDFQNSRLATTQIVASKKVNAQLVQLLEDHFRAAELRIVAKYTELVSSKARQ
jgi:hypothetical protein